jgi:DNA-binding NarL/FixJ family response regulator
MGTMIPSVLLVEDHAIMGQMLGRLLRERGKMELWGIVDTAERALDKLAAAANDGNSPDLVLVDVSLPGMSGIELVARLTELYPTLPCLMVSAHRDAGYVRQALDNGAHGYVAKGDPPAIIEAIKRVLDGEIYLSDDVRALLS